MSLWHLRRLGLPNLTTAQQTSPEDQDYNCVAWALGLRAFWWPKPPPDYYWPPGIELEETRTAFTKVFSAFGYQPEPLVSASAMSPTEFERVAFFELEGTVTHVARQLESGAWTSKLGVRIDIRHELQELVGTAYGRVGWFMFRRREPPEAAHLGT